MTSATKTPMRSAIDSVNALESFHQRHGRLPKSNSFNEEEKRLAGFLIGTLRQGERRGILPPDVRARAARIPGALVVRTVPDQDKLLAELAAFVKEHHHRPRHTLDGVPEHEIQLRQWIANNTAGNPELKSPRLQGRHMAILAILAGIPSYAEHDLVERIVRTEQFIREHGYRQPREETPWLNGYASGEYPLEAPFTENSRLNEDRARRIKAILEAPTVFDHRWQQQFDELKAFSENHAGRLPTGWAHPHFGWLTAQRSKYRRGKLAPERQAALRTLPGALPEAQVLTEAA